MFLLFLLLSTEGSGDHLCWSDEYGFLNSDLTHVGSGATAASVCVHLPTVQQRFGAQQLQQIARTCGAFGVRCEHKGKDVFRLTAGGASGSPLSEVEMAQQLLDALCCVLDVEDQLAQGATEGIVEDMVQAHMQNMQKLNQTICAALLGGANAKQTRHSSLLVASVGDSSAAAASAAAAAMSHADALAAQRRQQLGATVEINNVTTTQTKTMTMRKEEHVHVTDINQSAHVSRTGQVTMHQQIESGGSNGSAGGGRVSRKSSEDELDMPPNSGRMLPASPRSSTGGGGNNGDNATSPTAHGGGNAALTLQNSAKRNSFRGSYVDKMAKNFEASKLEASQTTTTTTTSSSGKVISYMDMNELVSTTATTTTAGGNAIGGAGQQAAIGNGGGGGAGAPSPTAAQALARRNSNR
jgi:hypothetical protein